MKNSCKTCGKNCEEEYCFRHKPRKQMSKKTSKQMSKMSSFLVNKLDKLEKKNERYIKQGKLFLDIWSKRPHTSEVSGCPLGKQPLTIFFHHILPKEKYPQAAFDEENIILLTLDEHTNVENDMYKYEEVNRRRELLKLKYDL